MTRRAQPEAAIQRAIVQHYQARAAPGVFMFAVPNGGRRNPIEAAIMKGTGTVAGVPDTIWIKGGHVYALEVKPESGKSRGPKACADQLREAGARRHTRRASMQALRA